MHLAFWRIVFLRKLDMRFLVDSIGCYGSRYGGGKHSGEFQLPSNGGSRFLGRDTGSGFHFPIGESA
jgi:hypothetical protein